MQIDTKSAKFALYIFDLSSLVLIGQAIFLLEHEQSRRVTAETDHPSTPQLQVAWYHICIVLKKKSSYMLV